MHELITVIGQILDARCWILDKQKRSEGGIENFQHQESRNKYQLRPTADSPIITSCQNIIFMQLCGSCIPMGHSAQQDIDGFIFRFQDFLLNPNAEIGLHLLEKSGIRFSAAKGQDDLSVRFQVSVEYVEQ